MEQLPGQLGNAAWTYLDTAAGKNWCSWGVQGCYYPAQVKSLLHTGDKSHSGLCFSVCAVAATAA